MAYAIMRMAKIKDKRGVVMAVQHNNRSRIPENANPVKSKNNLVYGGSTSETMARFEQILPKKIRSNAVMAVELVFTASPDFNGNWGGYLRESLDWGLKTFGIDTEEKDIRPAIQYAVHHDEKTDHVHLIVVPMKDGKLNAKHFIGGSRDRMAELQQDFWETVGKKYGLERGKSREETRARHTHHRLADLDEREKKINEEKKLLELQRQDLNRIANEEFADNVGKKIVATFADTLRTKKANKPEIKKFWEENFSQDLRKFAESRVDNIRASLIAAAKQKRDLSKTKSQDILRS